MIDQNFRSDEIEKMRRCLLFEGWVSSPNLPKKWLFKQSDSITASGACHRTFLTDKGIEIRSFTKAMEYLVENDGYTEKDFEGIQIFADEKSYCDDNYKRPKNKKVFFVGDSVYIYIYL